MIIGIIPKITEKYKDQFEFSLEIKLISFLNKVFPRTKIKTLFNVNIKEKFDILIISGGNDLISHKKLKNNSMRNKLNNFYFSQALKSNLPIIGICHGAHFIASKYNGKFKKTNSHVGTHKIFYENTSATIISHHNYKIQKISKKAEILALADDKSIELFKIKNKKIYGIVWHPERQKKIDLLGKKIFKNI